MLPYSNNIKKTIYINPNFKGQLPTPKADISMQTQSVIPTTTHINPLFLEARKYKHTIHMNPEFLKKFQEDQQLQPLQQLKIDDTINSHPVIEASKTFPDRTNGIESNSSYINNVTTEPRKIICKSKNLLIREPLVKKESPPLKLLKACSPQPPLLVLSKRKLVRKVTNIPLALGISGSKLSGESNKIITKYKLDNRVVKKKALLPPTPRIKRASFVGRYALRRTSVSSTSIKPIKKTMPINKTMNKKLQVLNINGLLYKSTQNSLKLKDLPGLVRTANNARQTTKQKSVQNDNGNIKVNQGLTIFVRGTKYVMDANKFKLTRVANNDQISANIRCYNSLSKVPTCKRIDIGGYTYISVNSSKNVLIRTSNHLSRAYVHNAKQKSLLTLTKRLVKTNIPCPIFQRIGKCAAFERGKCSKVHNKLQVAICSKFLRGECSNADCLLSHNVTLSKMPVCKFFLQGVCVRNCCPYLHKKLSNKAELCIEFLRGFCKLADKCNKRHEFVCPEIERNNVCTTKNCIYCKAKRRKELQIEKKYENFKSREKYITSLSPTKQSTTSTISAEDTANSHCKRYFVESCDITSENSDDKFVVFPNEDNGSHVDVNESINEDHVERVGKTRPKLGALPSYIPL